MSRQFGMSTSDPLSRQQGLQRTSSSTPRRIFSRFFGIAALIGFGLLAGSAIPAQAATVNLFAAPTLAGTGDCSSPADACTIDVAVTNANAASVADDVRIELKKGNYPLPAPTPTALPITFAGPSLTIESGGGTPTLDGRKTTRILSVSSASNVTIDGVDFVFGLTAGLGGAILNDGTATVKNSTFTGNTGGNGGGISNSAAATLTVEDSTFSRNSTTGVGGAAIISFGNATVNRSAILNNEGTINGGGINVQPGGTLTLNSSTVSGNSAGGLGGGLSNLGTLNVQASTIADNRGSGGAAIASGNTNATFTSTIVAEQASAGACNPVDVAIVDGGYNLDTDGTCISAATPATGSHNGTTAYGSSTYGDVLNSYLAEGPADNGGPTKTIALLNTPDPATDLADPAFDAIPPSFNLPNPVSGESAACKVSDQRGVVPATGAGCAIGAYLLQATETEITGSPGEVGQNESVTYTAKVSPEPDGGTVSFNDGAGNPATVQCASQRLAGDTATCTVSYPNAGEYQVNAAYSGDGADNNFAESETTTPATTTVVGPTPPIVDRPLRILGSTSNRRTGVNTIKVKIPAPGTVKLIGYRQLKNTSRHFGAKGTYKLKATPKGKLKRVLNERGRARTLVKITYIPDVGRPLAKSRVFPFFKDAQTSQVIDD